METWRLDDQKRDRGNIDDWPVIIAVATDLYGMYRGTPRWLFPKRELQQMAESIQISFGAAGL